MVVGVEIGGDVLDVPTAVGGDQRDGLLVDGGGVVAWCAAGDRLAARNAQGLQRAIGGGVAVLPHQGVPVGPTAAGCQRCRARDEAGFGDARGLAGEVQRDREAVLHGQCAAQVERDGQLAGGAQVERGGAAFDHAAERVGPFQREAAGGGGGKFEPPRCIHRWSTLERGRGWNERVGARWRCHRGHAEAECEQGGQRGAAPPGEDDRQQHESDQQRGAEAPEQQGAHAGGAGVATGGERAEGGGGGEGGKQHGAGGGGAEETAGSGTAVHHEIDVERHPDAEQQRQCHDIGEVERQRQQHCHRHGQQGRGDQRTHHQCDVARPAHDCQ